MKNQINRVGIFILAGVAIAAPAFLVDGLALAPVNAAAPVAAESVATDKIKDMTATLVVNNDGTDYDELKKIGGAFAATYRIKRMEVSYKNPNKVRFEGKALGMGALMIYNGEQKYFRVPLHTETQNVKGKAGQKQSLMDMGIFSKDYLTLDWKPTFVKADKGLLQYDLTQRDSTNKSHEMVWVNPKTSLIAKRQTFNGDNKLQKEMRFTKPTQIRPGIWVPTRIEIYNQSGKLGAVQDIQDIKINLGVDDDRFKIS